MLSVQVPRQVIGVRVNSKKVNKTSSHQVDIIYLWLGVSTYSTSLKLGQFLKYRYIKSLSMKLAVLQKPHQLLK